MNLKWLPALALATQLQAGVLPQGTQIWQTKQYTQVHLFDEAAVIPLDNTTFNSWISLYGALDGGTLFDTDLFSLTPTSTANLWWNLNDSGFRLMFIVVNDSFDNCKIDYLGLSKFGTLDLTTFDKGPIKTILLYGYIPGQPIPDSSWTITLLMLSLAILYFFHDKKTAC